MENKYKELFIATTDTVLGLGAPVSKENKELIYKLKSRPKFKPLVIMVGSIEQAREFEDFDNKAEEFAKKYWPGEVTLILSDDISLRMPNKKGLQDLIEDLGPVYMTSANISGEKIVSWEDATKLFPKIEKYYYFGKGSGHASKIIDVRSGEEIR